MPYLGAIPVYTTKLTNTHPNITPLGVVVGNDLESVSLGRAWLDNMASFVGGQSGLMRKKMDDLFKKAMRDLQRNTAKEFPQATAIYNAEFHFNTMNGGNPSLIRAGSSIILNIAAKGILQNGSNIISNAETQVTEDNQSRKFELAIIGTAVIEKKSAVIEKKSKTRRSIRRK